MLNKRNKRQILNGGKKHISDITQKTLLKTYNKHNKRAYIKHTGPALRGNKEHNMNNNEQEFIKIKKKRTTHLNFISFDSFERVISVPCNALINWQEEEIQAIIVSSI